jgi:hypothetical protein
MKRKGNEENKVSKRNILYTEEPYSPIKMSLETPKDKKKQQNQQALINQNVHKPIIKAPVSIEESKGKFRANSGIQIHKVTIQRSQKNVRYLKLRII